nr:YsnF/AvaK domain-containing protein [uncultured Sphingosinicella sp.]
MSDDREERIPLLEERLVTSKETVETGRVKVQTVLEEREEMVREQLSRAYVDIERVEMHVEVDQAPPVRQEGDTTIIPVVQELLVVQRKLVVTEEIRVRQRRVQEEHVEPVSLRSQRAVVERHPLGGEPVSLDGREAPPGGDNQR